MLHVWGKCRLIFYTWSVWDMGVSKNGGTPIFFPLLSWIFPYHPAIVVPPWLWKPPDCSTVNAQSLQYEYPVKTRGLVVDLFIWGEGITWRIILLRKRFVIVTIQLQSIYRWDTQHRFGDLRFRLMNRIFSSHTFLKTFPIYPQWFPRSANESSDPLQGGTPPPVMFVG